jgi:hypothetical protein
VNYLPCTALLLYRRAGELVAPCHDLPLTTRFALGQREDEVWQDTRMIRIETMHGGSLRTKSNGIDAHGRKFGKGERVFYYPALREIVSGERAEQAARQLLLIANMPAAQPRAENPDALGTELKGACFKENTCLAPPCLD